jgi:iron-regulated transporter 1
MQLETVGIWRGFSCIVGLLGTFAYHTSVKYYRLETTALWSVMAQFACLSISYASLWVEDYTFSLALLIGGVCASRIGLWVFDIAMTQLMQLQVPDNVRGVVGGVQQSLNAFFDLLAFGIGLFLPDPREFYVYVAAGYASVGIAALLYAFDFARKTTGSKQYQRVAPTCEDEAHPHNNGADLSNEG